MFRLLRNGTNLETTNLETYLEEPRSPAFFLQFAGIYQKWIASTKSTTMSWLFRKGRGGLALSHSSHSHRLSFSMNHDYNLNSLLAPTGWLYISISFASFNVELVDLAIVKRSILFQLRLQFMLLRLLWKQLGIKCK